MNVLRSSIVSYRSWISVASSEVRWSSRPPISVCRRARSPFSPPAAMTRLGPECKVGYMYRTTMASTTDNGAGSRSKFRHRSMHGFDEGHRSFGALLTPGPGISPSDLSYVGTCTSSQCHNEPDIPQVSSRYIPNTHLSTRAPTPAHPHTRTQSREPPWQRRYIRSLERGISRHVVTPIQAPGEAALFARNTRHGLCGGTGSRRAVGTRTGIVPKLWCRVTSLRVPVHRPW